MKTGFVLLSLAAAALIIASNLSTAGLNSQSFVCSACVNGDTINKMPKESFTAKITFRNIGSTKGAWSVNIAFEGEAWSWTGSQENLTLKPRHKKTLTWIGEVPEDAPFNSISRLIVYYNDSFEALNWWIHVIDDAELTIISSKVE